MRSTNAMIQSGLKGIGMPTISAHSQALDSMSLPLDLLVASLLVYVFVLRKRAGAVLLDLGRIRKRDFLLLLGGFWLFNGVFQILTGHRPYYGIACLLLSTGLYIAATQRLLICQKGIVATGGPFGLRLLRWEDILSYDLGDRGTLGLVLRKKGWTAFGKQVPFDDRQRVEALMDSRLPKLNDHVAG